jgi:hypothetical protein
MPPHICVARVTMISARIATKETATKSASASDEKHLIFFFAELA